MLHVIHNTCIGPSFENVSMQNGNVTQNTVRIIMNCVIKK